MKVLLINPNRYLHPPVPPIGLEMIAGDLTASGHEVRLLDLCFNPDPVNALDSTISQFMPDLAGITVRNADTVLYDSNEFFLDDIRSLIGHIKAKSGLFTVIGGAAAAIDPDGICDYLGADAVVSGPGEGVMNGIINSLSSSGGRQKIWTREHTYSIPCLRRSEWVDYKKYIGEGGIAGFETHRGCSSSCIYCTEANTKVSFREIPEVIGQIRGFSDCGITRFHLCDSEFNEDTDYSMEFLKALIKTGPSIDWAVYMKPAGHSRRLVQLMKSSGVSLITLTVDSWKKCPLYWGEIEKMIFSAKSSGIRIVVDFLTGFPYEDEDTLKFYLDLFRRLLPDSVGINTYIRLYKTLQVTSIIRRDPSLMSRLSGSLEDPSMIHPVFYNHMDSGRLRELIDGDPIFRIEGRDKGVNYTRNN
ncbi:MAG: cobalamin B12-binding domain-containing protein [Nitrospirae bacterium]|nr:cobalamin B12-binding domain-containing protein [Nitrospirota bacterium]